jgi:hypothetical protein
MLGPNTIVRTQCLPSEATIAPGESKAVEVTFSPDHARIWSYEQAFQVVVPGQTEKQFLQVSTPMKEQLVSPCYLGLTCLSTGSRPQLAAPTLCTCSGARG